jgi:plasmid stabilization system protein ParE
MAGGKYMISGQQKPKLVVTQNFLKELETVIIYDQTVFGDKVCEKFRKGVITRILALPSMPHANPINRFVESTERKVYRTIIYEKYYVIYSVTKTKIRVISIVHQATNPKKLSKIK